MKRALIGTGVGVTLLAGVFGANTPVQQDMKYLGGGQFYHSDPQFLGTTTLPYAFPDDDGNDLISYEIYEDSKGNWSFQQISDKLFHDIIYTNRGDTLVPTKQETTTVGSILLKALTPQEAHAAIAFDQQSKGVRISNTTISWTCNFAGSNVVALMEVGNNETADVRHWNTITVNGVATSSNSFVEHSRLANGGQGNMDLYAFFGPTSGTCSATIGGGVAHILDGHIVSYSGAIQSGAWNKDPNSILAGYQNATTTTNGTTFTQTTTPCAGASGSWVVWVHQNDTGGADTTGISGTNFITRNSTAAGAIAIGDTNTIASGATTQSTTTSSGASNWQGIQISIAPVGATCTVTPVVIVPPRALIQAPIFIQGGSVRIN